MSIETGVLTVRRHWRAMEMDADRRRHRRFDSSAVSARVSMIRTSGANLELEACTLLNVSFGGMCLRTRFPFEMNQTYQLLLDVLDPFREMVLVKARICWLRATEAGERVAGAEFVESSKGWLGPED